MINLSGTVARRTIWIVAFLLAAGVVVASTYVAVSQRSSALQQAKKDLHIVLNNVSQDITGSFEVSYAIMTALDNSIKSRDGTINELQSISREIASIASSAPRLREILFAESGGWVLASSLERRGIDRNVSKELFFGEALQVSSPTGVIAISNAGDAISIARRVSLVEGRTAGVIATQISTDYFSQKYAAFDAGRNIRVDLRSTSGATLLSYGTLKGENATRFQRNMAPLPVVVNVSWSEADMLRHWSRNIYLQIFATFGFLVLIAAIASLVSIVVSRREVEKRILAEQAVTDPLTGLGNRRAFMIAVQNAIRREAVSHFAVVLFDLDRFKMVNDTYGHAAGDHVLTTIAGRLLRAIGPNGTVLRLGGDEFAAVVSNIGTELDVSALLSETQQSLIEPIWWNNVNLTVGASVGVATFSQDGSDGDTLLQRADLAMYHAKKCRSNEVRYFEPCMETAGKTKSCSEFEFRLALERGEIQPYYEPIVELSRRQVVGFEIRPRWHHPSRGILEPKEFIELAEDVNLITYLTTDLIRQAMIDMSAWPDDARISINISPRQLREPLLANQIIGALQAGGLDLRRVEIELTENCILDDYELAKSVLSIFRLHGMTLALDEFGTGYSSLRSLRELRFDRLKIDRSFVQALPADLESARLVDAILHLAGNFELSVTAEGIETEDQAAMLSGYIGVSGQGYLFGRPMSGSNVLQFLDQIADAAA